MKVFLITGFNNWGKSTIIQSLFGRQKFHRRQSYTLLGKDFCVVPQSNDDFGSPGYQREVALRLSTYRSNVGPPTHLMSAFCPTDEITNNSSAIISALYSADQVHIVAIEYKWCLRAKLLIPELKRAYSPLPNVSIHQVLEQSKDKKAPAVEKVLRPLV